VIARRRPKPGRLLAALALAALALAACAGCGATAPTSAPGTPGASATGARGTGATGTTAPVSGAPDVTVDSGLLRLLPDSVGGLKLVEAPDAEAEGRAQPNLGELASSIAATFAATPESGDFVYAVVVGLRPGAMSDAKFRSWRETFDAGACSQAGGVTGNAEAQIAGRTTYIGTCAGGLHTYHVWLPAQARIVSISALGDRRLGELLLRALRE
jgi:hypothetical protein